ncbi:MAG: hypothetical protein AB7N24_12160 [Dehalococcoidia bacterium]
MGHRKKRKRERRLDQQSREHWRREPRVTEEDFIQPQPISLAEFTGMTPGFFSRGEQPRTCGNCRQFVEDHDFGRGTCLHIASGIMNPFTDTPACDYFERTKASARR